MYQIKNTTFRRFLTLFYPLNSILERNSENLTWYSKFHFSLILRKHHSEMTPLGKQILKWNNFETSIDNHFQKSTHVYFFLTNFSLFRTIIGFVQISVSQFGRKDQSCPADNGTKNQVFHLAQTQNGDWTMKLFRLKYLYPFANRMIDSWRSLAKNWPDKWVHWKSFVKTKRWTVTFMQREKRCVNKDDTSLLDILKWCKK